MDFMGIGPMELLLILVIALLVFGPKKLPEIGRTLGKTVQSFRKASQDITTQLTSEVEESQNKPREEVAKLPAEAASSQDKKAPYEVVKQVTSEAEANQTKAEGTTTTTETPR